MREPSEQARLEQQRQRLGEKIALIDAAWERSEWVLKMLRTKVSQSQPITPEEKLEWAKKLQII